jgi:S1-C subfamily serine protease
MALPTSDGPKGVTTVMKLRFLQTLQRRTALGSLSLILLLAASSPASAGDFKDDLGQLLNSELTDKIAALFEKHLKSRDERIAELEAKVASLLGEAPAAGPKVLLGVGHSPLSDEQREKLGADGVVVTQVLAGSPAEKAGLQAGDVILSVNGNGVNSKSFKKTVNWLKAGATADLVVVRDGEKSSKKVIVVDRDVFLAGKSDAPAKLAEAKPVVLGILLNEKLIVEEVDAGFTAAVAGLKAGDRITGLNGQNVTELDALADAVSKLKSGDKLAIKFVRDGAVQEASVVGGSSEGEAKLVQDAPKEEKKDAPTKDDAAALAFLGVDVIDDSGVRIVEVLDKTVAQVSGLQPDDIVVKANGKDIAKVEDLKALLGVLAVGDELDLVVRRKDAEVAVDDLVLGKEGEEVTERLRPKRPGVMGLIAELNRSKSEVFVKLVSPRGPAVKASLRSGDVILSVEGKKISSFDDLEAALTERFAGETIKLVVRRDGAEKEIELTLGEAGA